jgi:hypothetical protein
VLQPGGQFYLVDPTARLAGTQRVAISPGGLRLYSPEVREQLGAKVGLSCSDHHYLLGSVLLTIFVRSSDNE